MIAVHVNDEKSDSGSVGLPKQLAELPKNDIGLVAMTAARRSKSSNNKTEPFGCT